MIVPLTPLRFKRRALAYFANNTAAVCCGRSFTYREYFRRVDRLSRALESLGIRRGDRVAYLSYNCHRLLEGYYGVVQMGAVLLPLNIRLTPADLGFILKDSGARLLFFDLEFLDTVRQVKEIAPGIKSLVALEGVCDEEWVHDRDYDGFLDDASPEPYREIAVDENDLAELFYTSGTTADPKGVMLTHRSLYMHALSILSAIPTLETEVQLHTIPLFHVNGWGTPQVLTCVGGQHVMIRKFDAEEVLKLIETEGVTRFSAVPAMITTLLSCPNLDRYDVSSLKMVIIGGAASTPQMIRDVETAFKCSCFAGYGLTETCPSLSLSLLKGQKRDLPDEMRYRRQAMTGYAIPGVELRVVREDGRDVEANGNEIGEIAARSDVVMEGYWNRPEETADVMRDGWFHTGDLATVDEEGYLSIVDRAKDIIISGGENISSLELEEVISSHPVVLECAVIAVPDDTWGEVPKALVVLKDGMNLSAAALLDYCRGNLAGFKLPKSVEFFPSLPKGGTGKILKRGLRAKYWP